MSETLLVIENDKEAVSATPLFLSQVVTWFTKLLEIRTKKYLVTKRNT